MNASLPHIGGQLPHSMEAEQALLGAILINNEALQMVIGVSYMARNWSDIGDLTDDLRRSAAIYEPTLKAVGILVRSPDR